MTRTRWMTLGLASALGLSVLVVTAFAKQEHEGKTKLPEAAAAAITAAFPDATIDEVEQEDEDGVTVFDVELKKGDQRGEIGVLADGTVVEAVEWRTKQQQEAKDHAEGHAEQD